MPRRQQTVQIPLLLLAGLFFALHFLHLTADFPNHSPWMDWAKYTDEGWYGDAAIRHFDLGHWYVRGDFNPAAALPVWPFLEALVFRVTGVGVVPARALTVTVFGLILLCAFALLHRALPSRGPRLAPAGAVLLLAVSPFCYAFMRMAILEPLLVLLTLLALLAASSFAPEDPAWRRRVLPSLLLGLLLPLMVLTKTTAIFLLPSVAWMIAARCGFRLRPLLRSGGLAAAIAVVLWLLYFSLVVRHHFLEDYRYLFSANAYTGITLATAPEVLKNTLLDGQWIGRTFPFAILALIATVLWRRLRANATAVSLLLWALGYASFLAYHNNLQPRYYLVVAVPLTMLLALALELAWTPLQRPTSTSSQPLAPRLALAVLAAALVLVVVLATLEDLLGESASDHFDLIAGTSTGGILAIGLGMGLSPKDMLRFYRDRGPIIFPIMRLHRKWRRNFKHAFKPKHSQGVLLKEIQEALFIGGKRKTLGDSNTRLVVPAYDAVSGVCHIFRTPHHQLLKTDEFTYSAEGALATAAAPTYFSPAKVQNSISNAPYFDGGVWANCPAMAAIIEATCYLDVPLNRIDVLSIGTTNEPFTVKEMAKGGFISWRKTLIDLLMNAQVDSILRHAQQLVGEPRFLRINTMTTTGMYALDDASEIENLISLGQRSASNLSVVQQVRSRFLNGVSALNWR